MQEDSIAGCWDEPDDQALTTQEWRVTRLISIGYSNSKVAQTLSISSSTVQNHLIHIYQKLGVQDRVELTRWYVTVTTNVPDS